MALSQRPYGPSSGIPSGLNATTENNVTVNNSALPATIGGTAAGTTETVVPNGATSSVALVAAIPGKSGLEQIPFKIQASGYCKVNATTTTFTIKLYSGTSLTVASNTLLKSSGAITPNETSFPWFLEGTAIYDSNSGRMGGIITFCIDNQLVATAAFANVVASISDSNNPVLSFALTGTFSASNAANLLSVQAFSVG